MTRAELAGGMSESQQLQEAEARMAEAQNAVIREQRWTDFQAWLRQAYRQEAVYFPEHQKAWGCVLSTICSAMRWPEYASGDVFVTEVRAFAEAEGYACLLRCVARTMEEGVNS